MLTGFADESKSKGYIFSLVIAEQEELQLTRKLLRSFVLPAQRSLHFTKESPARRGEILKSILSSNLQLVIVETGLKSHKEGRLSGLLMLTQLAEELDLSMLCLERDDSTFSFDQKVLREQLSKEPISEKASFDFRYRHEEPMLWAADAIAWSYQRGADLRAQLRKGGVRFIGT